jgi:hypothetical protein
MQPDRSAAKSQRRLGLRVALAIAVGLTFDVATGAVVPFLGALFAAQFLVSGARPLPFGKAIGIVVLVLIAGQVFLTLAGTFGNRPLQLLSLLGLFYFVCFFLQAQGKGGAAIFLCLVIAIIVPLLNLVHRDLDESVIAILLQGVVGGVVLSWLAHALFPETVATEERSPGAITGASSNPGLRALANTVILLGAVTLCLSTESSLEDRATEWVWKTKEVELHDPSFGAGPVPCA